MRVAVHLPADHPESGGEQAVVAYQLGRIEEGVHNAPIGHPEIPFEDFLHRMLDRAHADYPDATVTQDESVPHRISLERLVDNGDQTSRWIPADQFDPEQHTPVGPGGTVLREVTADLSASSGA